MKWAVIIILAVSLFTAGVVSYLASSNPDGLERVAEDLGFAAQAKEPLISVLPEYAFPGLKGWMSSGLAGIIGVCATFGIVVLAGKIITRKKR